MSESEDGAAKYAIGTVMDTRKSLSLSPVLDDPIPAQPSLWMTQWRHDQETMLRSTRRAGGQALQISSNGEITVCGGRVDRDWVDLVRAVIESVLKIQTRRILIANVAGQTAGAALKEALTDLNVTSYAISPQGSEVPLALGGAPEIADSVIDLLRSNPAACTLATDGVWITLRRLANAIKLDLASASQPGKLLARAAEAMGRAEFEQLYGLADDSRRSLRTLTSEISKQEAHELSALAPYLHNLARFEGSAEPAKKLPDMAILHLDTLSVADSDRDTSLAVFTRYLKQCIKAESNDRIYFLFGADEMPDKFTRWWRDNFTDSSRLLFYRRFSATGKEAASENANACIFFRLAGRDAEEASEHFGSDEVWREAQQSETYGTTTGGSIAGQESWSIRGPQIGQTNTRTSSITSNESVSHVLAEQARVRPSDFRDLKDREFVLFTEGQGPRPVFGKVQQMYSLDSDERRYELGPS